MNTKQSVWWEEHSYWCWVMSSVTITSEYFLTKKGRLGCTTNIDIYVISCYTINVQGSFVLSSKFTWQARKKVQSKTKKDILWGHNVFLLFLFSHFLSLSSYNNFLFYYSNKQAARLNWYFCMFSLYANKLSPVYILNNWFAWWSAFTDFLLPQVYTWFFIKKKNLFRILWSLKMPF